MPQCHALKRNGHPCRGHGMPVTDSRGKSGYLCHMHRNFFSSDAPLQVIDRNASMFQTNRDVEWIGRMLKSPLCHRRPGAMMSHIQALLNTGDDYLVNKASYIYDQCVRIGYLPPLISVPLWKKRVYAQVCVLQYCAPDPSTQIYRESIRIILGHYFRNADPQKTFPLLLDAMRLPFNAERPDLSGVMWRESLEVLMDVSPTKCFASIPLQDFVASIDARHAAHPNSFWHREGIRDHFIAILRAHRDVERARLRSRVDVIREDLMMRAWAPERLQRWLDAGWPLEQVTDL